jgi:copper(I)-binding protein
MLSLVMQRIFSSVFMGLMMLSPAMASDLMFGALQFRATIGSMPSSAAYLSITNHGAMADRLLAVESSPCTQNRTSHNGRYKWRYENAAD